MRSSAGIYLEETLSQIPRLLGNLDRNPISSTFGCFDRQHWHYKTSDFPCARYQEAALTLALLYTIKSPKNPYYKSRLILQYINASINFWKKIQNRDGSFSEWYPGEHSFGPTAFTLYAISETLLILGDKISLRHDIINSLKRSGDWLIGKKEPRAQNQQCGAALALFNLFLLTDIKGYRDDCRKKLDDIAATQSSEGWLNEYNGADVGYLSLAIDYLSKYHSKSKDKDILKVIDRALSFISYFIHPDFTSGGEYGSRNTEYLIPHGFELMSARNTDAAAISAHIRQSLEKHSTISPSSLDDRYLAYITYTWLQAFIDSGALKEISPRYKDNFVKDFRQAGVYIVSNKSFYLVINYRKGGAFRLTFKNNGKSFYDGGVMINTPKGERLYSGQLFDESRPVVDDGSLLIEGPLFIMTKAGLMTPIRNVSLRLFQLTFGRLSAISLFVKNILRSSLITGSKRSDGSYKRKFLFDKKCVTVVDSAVSSSVISSIFVGGESASIFVPSSRYFSVSKLQSMPCSKDNDKCSIELSRIFGVDM